MTNYPHCEECGPNFTCQECLRDEWDHAEALRLSIKVEADWGEAIAHNRTIRFGNQFNNHLWGV